MRVSIPDERLDDPGVGLRDNGRRVLTYADLHTLGGAIDARAPQREIELHLTVRTLDPPALMIEVDPVEPSHVHFEIRSKGFQARVLERAGDVEGELRRQVAAFVNQVASPDARRYACVELMPLIESAWETL